MPSCFRVLIPSRSPSHIPEARCMDIPIQSWNVPSSSFASLPPLLILFYFDIIPTFSDGSRFISWIPLIRARLPAYEGVGIRNVRRFFQTKILTRTKSSSLGRKKMKKKNALMDGKQDRVSLNWTVGGVAFHEQSRQPVWHADLWTLTRSTNRWWNCNNLHRDLNEPSKISPTRTNYRANVFD